MLRYQPKPGSVVSCDFRGFIVPEMVKNRPVLVIHVHKHNTKLVTVIPISTATPEVIEKYHHELDLSTEAALRPFLRNGRSWFKCDLVYVLSIERMNMLENKDAKERFIPQVLNETLVKVKQLVRGAIEL